MRAGKKKKPGKFDSFWQIFAENQEEMSKIYDICKCIFSMNVISIIYVLYYYMKHVVKTIGKNQDLCSSLFLVVCYPQLQKLLLINGNGNSVFKLHLVRWVWLGKDVVPTTIWSRAILFAAFLRQISAADTTSVESVDAFRSSSYIFFSPCLSSKKEKKRSGSFKWNILMDDPWFFKFDFFSLYEAVSFSCLLLFFGGGM